MLLVANVQESLLCMQLLDLLGRKGPERLTSGDGAKLFSRGGCTSLHSHQ